MAWANIAAAETDANSPLNQTLMDKVRLNPDEIMRSKPILNIFGSCSRDLPGVATDYLMNANSDPQPAGTTARCSYRIYIPAGVTTLWVNVYMQCNQATSGVRVTIGAVNLDFLAVCAYSWQIEAAMVPGVIGWQPVTVSGQRNGAASAVYIRGITIRPNV